MINEELERLLAQLPNDTIRAFVDWLEVQAQPWLARSSDVHWSEHLVWRFSYTRLCCDSAEQSACYAQRNDYMQALHKRVASHDAGGLRLTANLLAAGVVRLAEGCAKTSGDVVRQEQVAWLTERLAAVPDDQ